MDIINNHVSRPQYWKARKNHWEQEKDATYYHLSVIDNSYISSIDYHLLFLFSFLKVPWHPHDHPLEHWVRKQG